MLGQAAVGSSLSYMQQAQTPEYRIYLAHCLLESVEMSADVRAALDDVRRPSISESQLCMMHLMQLAAQMSADPGAERPT